MVAEEDRRRFPRNPTQTTPIVILPGLGPNCDECKYGMQTGPRIDDKTCDRTWTVRREPKGMVLYEDPPLEIPQIVQTFVQISERPTFTVVDGQIICDKFKQKYRFGI